MKELVFRKITIGDDGSVIIESGDEHFRVAPENGMATVHALLRAFSAAAELSEGNFIAIDPGDLMIERRSSPGGPVNHFLVAVMEKQRLLRLRLSDEVLFRLSDAVRDALELREAGSRH